MDRQDIYVAAVAAVRWEDAEKTRVAATIDGQKIGGITAESRYWDDIARHLAAGGAVADPETEPVDARAAVIAELERLDRQSVRPLRDGAPGDGLRLAELRAAAAVLRAELARLDAEAAAARQPVIEAVSFEDDSRRSLAAIVDGAPVGGITPDHPLWPALIDRLLAAG